MMRTESPIVTSGGEVTSPRSSSRGTPRSASTPMTRVARVPVGP